MTAHTAMQRSLALAIALLTATTSLAFSPAVESTDAVVQHRGTLVAATASGLYRWSDPGWSLWYPWSLRADRRAQVEDTESLERLEQQRTFDELYEELLPVYGETLAEEQTEELLGYGRPPPALVPLEVEEERISTHSVVVQALASHGSNIWACTAQGVYQVGLSSHHHTDLGRTCLDMAHGSGLLAVATDLGVFLRRPGREFQRLARELPATLVGLAISKGRVFAATTTGVFELDQRPIRRSGAILDGFGRLGERLVGVTEGRLMWIGDAGRARPTGEVLDGNFVRASDGSLLVTSEGVWRWEEDRLARLGVPPGSMGIRDALIRGGLWLATAEGVIQPPEEEAPVSSLGVILDARTSQLWTQKLIKAYEQRGLSDRQQLADPGKAYWLPQVTLRFQTWARRGLGLGLDIPGEIEFELEQFLADEFGVDLDDVLELNQNRRADVAHEHWRVLLGFHWRPTRSGLGMDEQMSRIRATRQMVWQERRRMARRTSKLLVAHLASERAMILRPPRSLRATVMRILKHEEQRALLQGLLQQELP